MADIVTGTVTGILDTSSLQADHSDIRREAADHTGTLRYNIKEGTNEGVKETLKAGWAAVDATKDARCDVNTRTTALVSDLSKQIDSIDDTLATQASNYFIANQQYAFQAARDAAALKASTDMAFLKMASDIATQGALGQAATALESAKVAAAIALGQSVLSKEIFADGQKTRDLVNDLKFHDLNRALIERNAELVEERESRRHWRGIADQNQFGAQFAQLQSMMQNFNSQLQDTRQGMVNFGTMAGVGLSSTSNNVR